MVESRTDWLLDLFKVEYLRGDLGLVPSTVVSEPVAWRLILVDFADTGSHFSSTLPPPLPPGFLRKQREAATHFQIEHSRPRSMTNYSSSII